jgi:hypothetical protein
MNDLLAPADEAGIAAAMAKQSGISASSVQRIIPSATAPFR